MGINSSIFLKKKIVLGITASIAAYKAAYICSRLVRSGAQVIPVMTSRAANFINPITFSSLSGNETITGQFKNQGRIYHISLSHSADAYLIAPASADIICKLAHGVCDDFLTTSSLAAACPVLIAPAMNESMYLDPVVAESIKKLKSSGKYRIVGPAKGELACGETGVGRMEDEDTIIKRLSQLLTVSEELSGKKVVITAGGTREYIDMVRYISNASSGKMGYSLAREAYFRGAQKVVLISTVKERPVPYGVEVHYVDNTGQMKEAVLDHSGDGDIIIMAAAVSDIVPLERDPGKLSKREGLLSRLKFKLNENILDILSTSKRKGQFLIGFAAESGYNIENVLKKFSGKNIDMIIANDISGKDTAIGSDYNEVEIIRSGKDPVRIPRDRKAVIARGIWNEIIKEIN
ncbi:MAG: bifunctional phosphopantothenoylcysteine decarboxylase/phosphopantothenate--cysteine ligase CoaBC [Actinomycetia bacterium]|nr:bifunctional phosphopantothenoylcysteine decarboxylase/phosphopantothenate--cysteine ligase CoaBC [Actinomycetes bacterium]